MCKTTGVGSTGDERRWVVPRSGGRARGGSMVRGEPGGPRARQDALGKQAIYQTGNWRGMLGIEPLLVCAICSVFFQNSQEILLTSWAPGPQGPDCEKVGPFQAGPGSSSAMSPSLAHNLKDKCFGQIFGQKCFVLVLSSWLVGFNFTAGGFSFSKWIRSW